MYNCSLSATVQELLHQTFWRWVTSDMHPHPTCHPLQLFRVMSVTMATIRPSTPQSVASTRRPTGVVYAYV